LQSIKLSSSYAPSHYLLALVDLVTNERLDEALAMAQKARQLAPGKANYSLLLAQIHLRRSEPAEARSILEPLMRSSDTAVRTEAQSMLDSLSEGNTNAGTNAGGADRSTTRSRQVSSAMIAEPAESGSSPRMIGGSSSGMELRDGKTIDNSAALPSVDDVLNRYVEAMGGAAAINKFTSRVMTGTLDVAGVSRGGSFETYAQAPNKILMAMDAHPFGKTKVGFNGKSGWYMAQAAVHPVTGVDLAILQRDADFYSSLRTKNNVAKVTMPGISKIGYRDVYVLDLQPATGPVERVYLDAETFLPVRINTVRTVGRGPEPVEIYLDDWRDVDGVKYPFSITQNARTVKLGFTVKEIRHNVPIEAKTFQPPGR
jgi:hypothetical protein